MNAILVSTALSAAPLPSNYDLIHAEAVLYAPDEDEVHAVPPRLAAALRLVALRLEVLDQREARYYPFDTFAAVEVGVLRNRVRALKDAPPTHTIERLPPGAEISLALEFARAHRNRLQERVLWEADRATLLVAALTEQERLINFWHDAMTARSEAYYLPARRLALARVRDAIGPERFDAGDWPAYCPAWSFSPR